MNKLIKYVYRFREWYFVKSIIFLKYKNHLLFYIIGNALVILVYPKVYSSSTLEFLTQNITTKRYFYSFIFVFK